MQQTRFMNSVLGVALLSIVMTSCSRDSEDNSLTANPIRESEKLAIPDAIDPPLNLPGGNTRVLTLYAEGVQKYKAQPKAGIDPVSYEWVFVAPEAILYDASNKKVGTHGAGPFWELSAADSLFGQTYAPPKTAPSPEPNTIDWLLLMPKAGKTPTGVFANVSYIQRIATRGGRAPSTPPTAASDISNVKYSAVYRFTKKN